jgi:hypothetical protein
MEHAEGEWGVNPDEAARLTAAREKFRFGFIDRGQEVPAASVECLALRRQRQTPRRTLQEPRAQAPFEVADVA